MVVISLCRYLAICRPLQYKPGAAFYIILVFATSVSVNTGRFLEFHTETVSFGSSGSSNGSMNISRIEYSYGPTDLMADERYIMFSRLVRIQHYGYNLP